MKKIHFVTGIVITLFVVLHLLNHLVSLFGAEAHIIFMSSLRVVYRNVFFESILLVAVLIQITSGISMYLKRRRLSSTFFEKLQNWTGVYLAAFFLIHIGAVLAGRLVLGLDTNFYFGVAGLNSYPFNLFFIPYYAFAILSFFGHIASIHNKKMKRDVAGLSPKGQAVLILFFGIIVTIGVFYGATNHFRGVQIPEEYTVLIGK